MSESAMLVCEYRKENGIVPWNLDNYKNRGMVMHNCNHYRPAEGKKHLSPSCLWCRHSEIEYNEE